MGTIAANDANVAYSPGNWDVTSVRAKSINPGAYFRAQLNAQPGTLSLTFDTSGVLSQSTLPFFAYRVNNGPWTVANIAPTVALTIPGVTNDPTVGWDHCLIEVVFCAAQQGFTDRFGGVTSHVSLTGIVTDVTAATVPTFVRPLRILVFGDSISEGRRTLQAASTGNGVANDVREAWSWLLRNELGAEVGIVAFGATGWNAVATSSGNTPATTDTYDALWAGGPARSFAGYDAIVFNLGTNGNEDETMTAAVTEVLNGVIAGADEGTPLILFRPFNGDGATQIQAGIAASSNPEQCHYIDTAGWWDAAQSATDDNLHPFGFWHRTQGAPRAGVAIRDVLYPSGDGGGGGNRYVSAGGEWVAA